MLLKKTIFIGEFITGGGLVGNDLPNGLLNEGLLMRNALIKDVLEINQWRILTTHDERVLPASNCENKVVKSQTECMPIWQNCMQNADYVWLIAPETNQVLYQLTKMALQQKKTIVGCGLKAIEIASSKLKTYQHFSQYPLAIIPTLTIDAFKSQLAQKTLDDTMWIIKPDDGAGCEDTWLCNATQVLEIAPKIKSCVIQPYGKGLPCSVNVLSVGQHFQVLSCNQQTIVIENGKLSYKGGVINGAINYLEIIRKLVADILQILPELQGYWGADFIINEHKQTLTLIEINPRLTTSYSQLKSAMGVSPAQLILEAISSKSFNMPLITFNKVAFDV
jgi:tyramine---L-glutamate ligase